MTESAAPKADCAITPSQEAEMKRLGILRVTIDTFHIGGYRYTNLADAISRAERSVRKKA